MVHNDVSNYSLGFCRLVMDYPVLHAMRYWSLCLHQSLRGVVWLSLLEGEMDWDIT